MQIDGLHSAKTNDGQKNAREDMEADGQSRKAVSAKQNEPEKQPAFYSRHPTRHLPAIASDLLEVRGSNARPAHQRTLQHLYK